jgi:hypothetical protein
MEVVHVRHLRLSSTRFEEISEMRAKAEKCRNAALRELAMRSQQGVTAQDRRRIEDIRSRCHPRLVP